MSIKFVKRASAGILGRGESAVRIKTASLAEAKKALTKDDVRELIRNGSIYAIKEKKNISVYGKELKIKRNEGRSRGPGSRRGRKGARPGVAYTKRIRGQRRVLKKLKKDGLLDNSNFKKLYSLVKGGTFASKITLLRHVQSIGVQLGEDKIEELRHI